MRKITFFIVAIVFISVNIISAQFEFEIEVSKGGFEENKCLIVDLFLKNTADSTVNILFGNQESCQVVFTIDDYHSSEGSTCFPASQVVLIPSNSLRQYQYILYENEFGLPKFDGTHKVVAGILFYHPLATPSASTRITLKDSTYFESPIALGGRVNVSFDKNKDSLMTSIKDSLNVNLLKSNFFDFTESYYETWQFFDVLVDTMVENLKSNPNFKSVEVNRILESPSVSTITSIEDKKENQPSDFRLYQNYPNPFNPITKINYTIPLKDGFKQLPTTLTIFNLLGEKISVLVNEHQKGGNYVIEFDGGNLTSGIYIYQLKVGNKIDTKKMVLLK